MKKIDLATPITKIPFPTRVLNALNDEKIATLDELLHYKRPLLMVPKLGYGSLKQVEKTLLKFGLHPDQELLKNIPAHELVEAKAALKRETGGATVQVAPASPPKDFLRISGHVIKRDQVVAVGPLHTAPGKAYYDVVTLGGPIRMRFMDRRKARNSRKTLLRLWSPIP